jgi:hypothetical protein
LIHENFLQYQNECARVSSKVQARRQCTVIQCKAGQRNAVGVRAGQCRPDAAAFWTPDALATSVRDGWHRLRLPNDEIMSEVIFSKTMTALSEANEASTNNGQQLKFK